MEISSTARRLVQAQAYAEANPRPTSLRLWRDGVAIEMWDGGRRITHHLTWFDIETAHTNPIPLAIDSCASSLDEPMTASQ